jgi:hypothetical protein
MKRRTLVKTVTLAILTHVVPRFAWAQARASIRDNRELIDAIAEVVLPSTLGSEGRKRAVEAFVTWLEEYKAGVPMSYGYGSQLRRSIVPPSPALKYLAQFRRLQALSATRGATFTALSLDDRKAVVEAALHEAKVVTLPERPNGQHVASDLLSHFYSSSAGNDFLFNASIRVSECRGLDSSSDRPISKA